MEKFVDGGTTTTSRGVRKRIHVTIRQDASVDRHLRWSLFFVQGVHPFCAARKRVRRRRVYVVKEARLLDGRTD